MFRDKQDLPTYFAFPVRRMQWKQYKLQSDVFCHTGSHQETLLEEETIRGLQQHDV